MCICCLLAFLRIMLHDAMRLLHGVMDMQNYHTTLLATCLHMLYVLQCLEDNTILCVHFLRLPYAYANNHSLCEMQHGPIGSYDVLQG